MQPSSSSSQMLNMGCGSIYHPDWVNIDMVAADRRHVQAHDLRQGLPYADHSFVACYSSHFLEHLDRGQAFNSLRECWRVLQSGGILRVVVPDLETIARHYLELLDQLDRAYWANKIERSGDEQTFKTELANGISADANHITSENQGTEPHNTTSSAKSKLAQMPRLDPEISETTDDLDSQPELWANYDWIMLELLEQSVRSQTGGEMGAYLANLQPEQSEFVRSRIGAELDRYQAALQSPVPSRWHKLRTSSIRSLWQKVRVAIARQLVWLVAGKEASNAFEIGLFRTAGEIHQWMYDRCSLARLLEQVGFSQISFLSATTSQIPDFDRYELDYKDGQVLRPNSIFVEAIKP
ncbi:Methyltransferase type 11 [Thalassoporum mexicanum PCC 7367]|uniref:class I SAM-dependent methyltransferase n=1 Tax=Thalassoporum mexicanum TaxID=3457544 RepID=UPI00029F9589|nr:methyltransferase domain-containing protein [Pseudanabaena sp. PCC 7367]AFY71865.1 Methyltransferase type 11 [Pseudanabaena sp. PCC 7367]